MYRTHSYTSNIVSFLWTHTLSFSFFLILDELVYWYLDILHDDTNTIAYKVYSRTVYLD